MFFQKMAYRRTSLFLVIDTKFSTRVVAAIQDSDVTFSLAFMLSNP